MIEQLPYTRGSETSKAAAEVAALTSGACRALVHKKLLMAGPRGMTHEQLETAIGLDYAPSGVRTRCNELVKRKLVMDSGTRRRNRRGREVTVWVAVGLTPLTAEENDG